MAGMTDFAENAIHNAMYRGTAFPTLNTIYFALFTALPADDGTGGTEVSATGYARVAMTANGTNFKDPSTATQGDVSNLVKIVWPVQNAAIPATVLGFGWFDAATNGNCWLVVDSNDISVDALGQPYIEIAGFTHTIN
jgi:hypothetical protein